MNIVLVFRIEQVNKVIVHKVLFCFFKASGGYSQHFLKYPYGYISFMEALQGLSKTF